MQRNSSGGSGVLKAIAPVAKIVKSAGSGAKAAKTVRKSSSSSSRRSSSSRSSGGGSSSRRSSGGGGGGGGGSYTPAPRASAPRPLKAPDINSYLGTDSVYQSALSGGKRSLADYLSELTRRRGEATTQYNQTKSSMERDREQQLADLENEFASRGLIQSGLYGEEQGRFQQQFTDQLTALDQQQTGLLADLLSQQKNYQRENDLAMQQAKQEALARRAAKYKIGA